MRLEKRRLLVALVGAEGAGEGARDAYLAIVGMPPQWWATSARRAALQSSVAKSLADGVLGMADGPSSTTTILG